MPVQIGAKVHDFNDPTGLLTDCHRRIEMFLRSLHAVAQVIDSPPSSETRRALQAALEYFRDAAPKHTADEEGSLFPRLRELHTPEVEIALSNLSSLETEHRWAQPLHARVEQIGMEYLDRGELPEHEVEEFRRAVADLAPMYERHIAMEDEVLFPIASKALSAQQKRDITEEMAQRRNISG